MGLDYSLSSISLSESPSTQIDLLCVEQRVLGVNGRRLTRSNDDACAVIMTISSGHHTTSRISFTKSCSTVKNANTDQPDP